MTKHEQAKNFSRRTLLKAGGALVVSIGAPVTFDTAHAADSATAVADQTAADARPIVVLHHRQRRRHRLGLFRQNGHGPGAFGRHQADDRRGTRRSVRQHEDFHRRHRYQPQSGRRLRLDRRPGGRQADAHGRRRGAPRAGRHGGRETRRSGRPTHGEGRRRQRHRRCKQKDELRRSDRRQVFQRASRLERQIRQPALCAGQSQAEGPEGLHHRRQAYSARRHRRQGVRAGRLRHGHQSPRHGAWPHDPAGDRRRGAGESRRKLDQGYPGREGRLGQGLPRRRRRHASGTPSRRHARSRSNGRMPARRSPISRLCTITSAKRRPASATSANTSATSMRRSRPPRR